MTIYLDHAASAPLRPEARAAWLAASETPGNPASLHGPGRRAAARVETARKQVATLVGRPTRDVRFTAGGTEANNLAILGRALAIERAGGPRRALRSAIEHASVRGPFEALAARGWDVSLVPVDGDGVLELAALEAALLTPTSLVSVMAVNNEMGARQPLAEVLRLAQTAGATLHVDAVQAAGQAPADVDLVTMSAHKLGGPVGIGALLVAPGVTLTPLLHGGAHERGLRPGTLPTAAIAAFGAAAQASGGEMEAARLRALRAHLADLILAGVPGARMLGRPDALAPHVLALVLPGVVGEALVEQLDLAGVAASTGAACTVLGTDPSPVLPALGLDEASVQGSLRLSLGWSTTAEEVERAGAIVAEIAHRLQTMRPMAN